MRLFLNHRGLPSDAKGAVVALGNFDGVHLGHQALIKEARRIASALKRPCIALVFEPYPREFFRPKDEPFRLTPLPAKARLLGKYGVDDLVALHFDAEMAAMSAQDFVVDVLVKDLGVAHVVVGGDFLFGKNRAGDATLLSYMGEMEGFGVTIYSPVMQAGGGEKISSSCIRDALKAGKPEEAARLLGHHWSVEGEVAKGDQRGRTIGFPTANLKLLGVLQPARGVYALRAKVEEPGTARTEGGHWYDAVANFGIRPTFEIPMPLLEVHLFDFAGDLYGKTLVVEFVAFLRPERKFDGLDALKAQIAADAAAAKKALSHLPP